VIDLPTLDRGCGVTVSAAADPIERASFHLGRRGTELALGGATSSRNDAPGLSVEPQLAPHIAAIYTGAVELDEALFRNLLSDSVRRDEFERQSGVRHRKKFDERLVMEKIYGSRGVSEVVWDERPDFRLRSRPGHPQFGVEVVRFFDSQSSASRAGRAQPLRKAVPPSSD
jgi:hypothetical protein